MISVFRGLILPKFYWGCTWSSRGQRPLRRLFRIGKLLLYLTSYYPCRDKYKPRALEYLGQFVKIKDEKNELCGDRTMKMCYSKQDGSYVGVPEDVLCYLNIGIREFYKAHSTDTVASIGYAPNRKKWYGWSHRAISGFGIGHIVKESAMVRESGWIEGCSEYEEDEKTKPTIGFTAKTFEDCRYLAIRFAGSVG